MMRINLDVLDPRKQDSEGRLVITLVILYCGSSATFIYANYLAGDQVEKSVAAALCACCFVGGPRRRALLPAQLAR